MAIRAEIAILTMQFPLWTAFTDRIDHLAMQKLQ
jgi:hypothetical protein